MTPSSAPRRRHRDRFDPASWAAILEGPDEEAAGYLFRRGIELAARVCAAARPRGACWLDLGCGTGHLAGLLERQGLRVLAADHDLAMLRFARHAPVPAEVALVAARASELPLRDGTVDGVVAVSLLGCLDDPEAVLRSAARVVRPGGFLVATATSASSLARSAEHAFARVAGGTVAPGAPAIRSYRVAELRRLASQAGFTVQSITGYGLHLQRGRRLLPPARLSRALENRLPAVLERYVARNLLLVARRSGR